MRTLIASLVLLAASAGGAAPCPCEKPLRAGFRHEASAGRYVTSTSIVVPAPLEEVASVIEDVASYPTWLFTGPDGAPTLHDVKVDAATGACSLVIGKPGRGTPLTGTITRRRDAGGATLAARGTAPDVREWAVEVAATPDPACAQRTRIALRLEMLYGLKARVFGGSAKSMPSLLALGARDDLAARFLKTSERLECAGVTSVSAGTEGTALVTLGQTPPARVLRCRPGLLVVGKDRASSFGRTLEAMQRSGKRDMGALIEAMHAALDGEHDVASWQLDVEGRPDPVMVGTTSGGVHCAARVAPQPGGFALTLGAGATP